MLWKHFQSYLLSIDIYFLALSPNTLNRLVEEQAKSHEAIEVSHMRYTYVVI